MPPRRSESPEGVGDLLKQDSFGFEEDEGANEAQGMDTGQGPADAAEAASKDDQSGTEGQVKANGASASVGEETRRGQQGMRGSFVQRGRGPARYFIVKSNNHSNIDHSIKNGIWATQKHNEDKLVDAYRTASHVYLVFSVNMSGHFQGYARMSGLPFRHQAGAWEGSAAVTNSFNVDWVRRYDLPFRETESMTNPMNENKPVKISRDGQELPLSLGLQLCRLFDEGADTAGVPKPPPPVRNPAMRAGPAVSGGGRGSGRGNRGAGQGQGQSQGQRGPAGMVMTPMGPMPAAMAMGMGMGGHMMGPMGFGGPGMMDEMSMMGAMGMGGPMGMHPMMGGMGPMMGMNPAPPGPVPPPRPPPRSPGRSSASRNEPDFRSLMNGLGAGRSGRDGSRSREEEIMLRALEIAQRGRSPRRDRRYRSRSRSASPRRGRSRRHSHSRSRSRSRGRGRDSLLDMSYDDYLEAFKALKKVKSEKDGGSSDHRAGGRDEIGGGSGGGMAPMMTGMGGRGGQAMGPGMRGQPGGGGNMTEEEYVRVWENYSRMTGRPFDAHTVRGWYRQYKQFGAGNS